MSHPLLAVERAVQERARVDLLHRDDPVDRERVSALVDDEIRRWNDEHRRGRRPHPIDRPDHVADLARRNLLGYGPLEPLLDDPDVWEIMINEPRRIFVRRHRGPSGYHDEVFHDDEHVARVLTRLLDDHAVAHRKLDPAEGLQDAQLQDGSRLHIVHPELARGGHHLVNIRRFTGVAFRHLEQLVETGTLDPATAGLLRDLVRARRTIVVAGAPGAGKTTMLSCLTAELDPSLRVVVAEEVVETEIPLANVAGMQTRPARGERDAVDLRRLVAGFLRMAPDVAVVGEVRDREALPLLLTLSSGVTGYTTIHAGSAAQALGRLRFVAQLDPHAGQLSSAALHHLVADSVDVVVHLRRTDGGPVVSEVLAVDDPAAGDGAVRFTTTPMVTRSGGRLEPTGLRPHRLSERCLHHGVDLEHHLAVR